MQRVKDIVYSSVDYTSLAWQRGSIYCVDLLAPLSFSFRVCPCLYHCVGLLLNAKKLYVNGFFFFFPGAFCGSTSCCRGLIEMNEEACIFLLQCLKGLLQRDREAQEQKESNAGRESEGKT